MSKDQAKLAIIIVTHDSHPFIEKCLTCIEEQSVSPMQVIIVDSGSAEMAYLHPFQNDQIKVVYGGDQIGFCRANNIGWTLVKPAVEYILFLNPDAFLTKDFIKDALSFMEETAHQDCGAVTGTTLGFDIAKDSPTGLYDSTGVFQQWWGRWYDRAQGKTYSLEKYQDNEAIPAICGAIFFARKSALQEAMLPNEEVFRSSFFMYKEDIDLSLRLKSQGWRLMFVPKLLAYHCRGWNPKRQKVPKIMRLYSAANELKIHWQQKKLIPIFYSLIKYWAVKSFNI